MKIFEGTVLLANEVNMIQFFEKVEHEVAPLLSAAKMQDTQANEVRCQNLGGMINGDETITVNEN